MENDLADATKVVAVIIYIYARLSTTNHRNYRDIR